MALKRYKVTVLVGRKPLRATTDFVLKPLRWVAAFTGKDPTTFGVYRCRDGARRTRAQMTAYTDREGIEWCRGRHGKKVRGLLAAAALAGGK